MTKIRILFAIALLSCIFFTISILGIFACVNSKVYTIENKQELLNHIYYDECIEIANDCASMIDGSSFIDALRNINDKYEHTVYGISVETYSYTDTTSNYKDNTVVQMSYNYNTLYDGEIIYHLKATGLNKMLISVSVVDHNSNACIQLWNNRYNFIISASIMGIIFIGSFLLIGIFARKTKPLFSPSFIDKCPSYLFILIGALIILHCLLLIYISFQVTFPEKSFINPFLFITVIPSALIITFFAGGITRRISLKRFYNELLVHKAGQKYGVFIQGLIICGYCTLIIVAGVLLSLYVWKPFFIIATAIVVILWILHILNIHKLNYLIQKYCEGNWSEYPTTDPLLIGNIFNNLHHLSASMQATVEKSVRDERTKTELITNVSHDIKTPLTSIINYTDLLKREDLSEEDRIEYLNVLSKNSARMKKLIEDLIEASKAATGNIELYPIECSIDTLLSQAVVEHEPDAKLRNLKFVFIKNPNPVIINIDGKLLYRVFDNLLSNAVKYSLSGSRIYIDLVTDDMLQLRFKNITEEQITVSPEELTERFVKGDMSRHSEGSGLGLAICKNLVELMGGKLQIDIDGDQFMVELVFPFSQ